jgi:cyclophilin family peptidyl-prolyl cis-trans isomerase
MKKSVTISAAIAALILSASNSHAQKAQPAPAAPAKPVAVAPSPNEIVAAAPASDWQAISASDLLVMQLAPDHKGNPRRVVIQLMPAPFSQGHVGNIRKLAQAKFWDGTAIVRVQDNYVTQWGDPDGEDAAKAKKLPDGLAVVPESAYAIDALDMASLRPTLFEPWYRPGKETKPSQDRTPQTIDEMATVLDGRIEGVGKAMIAGRMGDSYTPFVGLARGFPIGWTIGDKQEEPAAWPVHCYGMVGVGRNLSPDTGTGAELYTVIGHAPRHLDRNIALVGRVIEGMEHMSSLPRGTGALGFYEKAEDRTQILSVRLMSDMLSDKSFPEYEYLSTESDSFAKYADARANRRDPFFITPAGGADICNIPVPVRRQK